MYVYVYKSSNYAYGTVWTVELWSIGLGCMSSLLECVESSNTFMHRECCLWGWFLSVKITALQLVTGKNVWEFCLLKTVHSSMV